MFVGRLRMAVGLRRFLTTLRVLALAVMFGSHLVALRGVLVVFRRLVVSVLGHASPPSFELRRPSTPRGSLSFPTSLRASGQLRFYPDWRPGRPVSIAGPPIGTCRALWRLVRQKPAQRQEDTMFSWAIAFLVIALIAGALGFGVVAGTAFAAAKIVFVVALIAFLISGVLGLTRRGMP